MIVVDFLISMGVCFTLDRALVWLGERDTNTRYYAIHALANLYFSVLSCQDVWYYLWNFPFSQEPQYLESMSIINYTVGLHLYHTALQYRTLTTVDWIHHGVSNFLTVVLVNYYFPIRMANVTLFFMCGFPGGTDYLMLWLVKHHYLESLTEKKINTYLNQYIRVPGLLFSSFLYWLNYLQHPELSMVESILGIFLIISIAMNGLFFNHRVCVNYGYRLNEKLSGWCF